MTPDEIQKFNNAVTTLNAVSKKLEDFLNIYHRSHFNDHDVFDKQVYFNQTVTFNLPFILKDGTTISLGSTNGGVLGATGDKIGFLGAAPIARQVAISAPSGGATQDTQARAAITSLINVLKNFGFTA